MTKTDIVSTDTGLPAIADLYGQVNADDAPGPEDVVIPQLKIVQGQNAYLMDPDSTVRSGQVIIDYGFGDPTIVVDGKNTSTVEAYVLGISDFAATLADGNLRFHPSRKRDPNDDKSWEGKFVWLAIPEHESQLPIKVMLWKSNKRVARSINTAIARKRENQDNTPLRVKLGVRTGTSQNGQTFYMFAISNAQTDPEDYPALGRIIESYIPLREYDTQRDLDALQRQEEVFESGPAVI